MRTTFTPVIHAISADDLGQVAIIAAQEMTIGTNKRERKRGFTRLRKLYRIAYPGTTDPISHISLGADHLGTLIFFFHLERLA